tara:strand:- start:256 stop:723 length:468 start_codon:yes stop_codon:yes gene_type:complete
MAFLIFKKEEGLVKTEATLLRAAKTEADAQLVHNGHLSSVEMINITDEEYDSFLVGDVTLRVINEVPSFENVVWQDPPPDDHLIPNQENFENLIKDWKEDLTRLINKRSTHSQIGKVTSALDFITNLDPSSLTYPTLNIEHRLKAENKYIDLRCI